MRILSPGRKSIPSLLIVKVLLLLCAATFVSCSRKSQNLADSLGIKEMAGSEKTHQWFSFTKNSLVQVERPEKALPAEQRPWTEAVRISSMASIPFLNNNSSIPAFAIVNRLGVLALTSGGAKLYDDASVFSGDTAESIVFNGNTPIFYLYKSSFFNEKLTERKIDVQPSRPFLIEFNPQSKICYPLVTYNNLSLSNDDQISGCFWDGKTWACVAKKINRDKVDFSYFFWEPLIPLTDISPALSANSFSFRSSSEREYTALTMPRLYRDAPAEVKSLLKSIPKTFTFFITWRDESGTSPKSYYQDGNGSVPLNAHGAVIPPAKKTIVVFADGTTYIRQDDTMETTAFRLPKLPRSYVYGDFALAGNTLYVAWEEAVFYKTGRSGFIQVNLGEVLASVTKIRKKDKE